MKEIRDAPKGFQVTSTEKNITGDVVSDSTETCISFESTDGLGLSDTIKLPSHVSCPGFDSFSNTIRTDPNSGLPQVDPGLMGMTVMYAGTISMPFGGGFDPVEVDGTMEVDDPKLPCDLDEIYGEAFKEVKSLFVRELYFEAYIEVAI